MQIVMEIGRLFLFRILRKQVSVNDIKVILESMISKLDGNLLNHIQHCILDTDRDFQDTDFDISTLLSIIRIGKVLGESEKPTDGWGKPKVKHHNINKGDDIERIRLMRNSLCHNPVAAMDDTTFQQFKQDIMNIAHRWYRETGNLLRGIEQIADRSLSGPEINNIMRKFIQDTKHGFSLGVSQQKATELHVVVNSLICHELAYL